MALRLRISVLPTLIYGKSVLARKVCNVFLADYTQAHNNEMKNRRISFWTLNLARQAKPLGTSGLKFFVVKYIVFFSYWYYWKMVLSIIIKKICPSAKKNQNILKFMKTIKFLKFTSFSIFDREKHFILLWQKISFQTEFILIGSNGRTTE